MTGRVTTIAIACTCLTALLVPCSSAKAKPKAENGRAPDALLIPATTEFDFMRTVATVDPHKRREFTAGFLASNEHKGIYGPALVKAFDAVTSVSPDRRAEAVLMALVDSISDMGCNKVFKRLANYGPGQRNEVFALECPPSGQRAVEPDLAANAPLEFVLLATVMDGRARNKGFADSRLHKTAMNLFLEPRDWLDSNAIIVTITLNAIWLGRDKVVDLKCEASDIADQDKCRELLRKCTRDPLAAPCEHGPALWPGPKTDKMLIADLAGPVKKRMTAISEMLAKLAQLNRYELVFYIDSAVPYHLVMRTIYTVKLSVPEGAEPGRFIFPGRPPGDDYYGPEAFVADLPAAPDPEDDNKKPTKAAPPMVLLHAGKLLLRAEHRDKSIEKSLPGLDLEKCGGWPRDTDYAWLALHRKLMKLKEGSWASTKELHLGAAPGVPWAMLVDAYKTAAFVLKVDNPDCGLGNTSVLKKTKPDAPEFMPPQPVGLFPEVRLIWPN